MPETVYDCEFCADNDPRNEVPPNKVGKIRLLNSNLPLPAGARDVYYAQKCWLDCWQYIRFDLPLDEARTYALSFPLEHPLTKGANPWGRNPWGGGRPPSDEVIGLGWWPHEFPNNVEGGSHRIVSDQPPLDIALVPKGERATIWIFGFST